MNPLFAFSIFLNLVIARAYRNEPDDSEDLFLTQLAVMHEEAYLEELTSPRTQTECRERLRQLMAESTWFD